MKKIVSYALWGGDNKYLIGAIRNASDVKKYYPGWIARFYCGKSVPEKVIKMLKAEGAEVILKEEMGDNRGMFWRFEALEDENVERVIVRDTDSRISRRECMAVQEWVDSGVAGHIMRDHPWHGMVMLGGMWGCTLACRTKIKDAIKRFDPLDERNQDQLFLAKEIYPLLIEKGCMIHDSFFYYEAFSKDFPSARESDFSFVGEQIDENEKRNSFWKAIKEYDDSFLVRMKFKIKRVKNKIKNKIYREEIYI